MSDPSVEATGETVSEAKWRALRELELLVPSLDKESVRFQVLSEGERGLLGVGSTPARVLATGAAGAPAAGGGAGEVEDGDSSDSARRLRGLLDARRRGDRHPVPDRGRGDARVTDRDLLRRRPRDPDRPPRRDDRRLQVLANAIAGGTGEERREVVVDAAGYRDRRRRTLETLALRSAEEALRTGDRVELEPMSAAERKIVHNALQEHEGVTTASEGDGPDRRVVVEPVR